MLPPGVAAVTVGRVPRVRCRLVSVSAGLPLTILGTV